MQACRSRLFHGLGMYLHIFLRLYQIQLPVRRFLQNRKSHGLFGRHNGIMFRSHLGCHFFRSLRISPRSRRCIFLYLTSACTLNNLRIRIHHYNSRCHAREVCCAFIDLDRCYHSVIVHIHGLRYQCSIVVHSLKRIQV